MGMSRTKHLEPKPSGRRGLLWLELALAAAIACGLAILAIGFLVNATAAQHHGSASRGGPVAGAVVCVVLLILCGRWAIWAEHRLRRHQPVAAAFEHKSVIGDQPASARRSRRRGHYGPVSVVLLTLACVGGTVGFTVGAISFHSQASRSNYVQHHGTVAEATVVSVDNTQHCSKSGCHYTAALDAALSPPVDGTRTTTAHYPGFLDEFAGDKVRLLLDPRQPGYAEIPGYAFKTAIDWILFLVFALIFAAFTALVGVRFANLRAHRREHRAGEGIPSLTADSTPAA
jgi:hypothetical protein